MVVRPEHAQIVGNGTQATLSGKLEHIVYFGTDTHFHVRLQDGSEFIVRQQNSRGRAEQPRARRPGGHRDRRQCRPGAEGLMSRPRRRGRRRQAGAPRDPSAAGCCRRRRCSSSSSRRSGRCSSCWLYSFMAKGDYGDVKYWQFSLDGWFSVLLAARHLRRHAHASPTRTSSIFWRSVKLSLHHHRADPAPRLPDRLFHRHAAGASGATSGCSWSPSRSGPTC